MIIDEYALYGLRGRTGTTFLRNQLGKYNEFMCLTTDKQIEFLEHNYIDNHINTFYVSDYVDYDIKSKFSKNQLKIQKVNTIIYKMPIYKIMNKVSLSYINRIKPILVLRNPVLTVLSTSKKDFLKNSDSLEHIFQSLLNSYKKLNISCPIMYKDFFGKYNNDILMQNAVLLRMSFYLYKTYFTKFYKDDFLIFSFEDFIDKPVNSMELILDFFKNPYDKEYIKIKLKKVFFDDVKEEGGIVMSANLSKSRNNNYNQNDFDKVYEYLKYEIDYLGYSYDNKIYPKTIIANGQKYFEDKNK